MTLMKVFEFDPVIYPYKLWVCLDKEPNKIADLFDEYHGKKIVFIDGDTNIAKAFTMPVMDSKNRHYGVVVFIRSKASLTYQLVAHEATHAAKYLFEHIGCDTSVHEPLEYVVGWIADCIYKVKTNKVEPTKTV